jgi:hypothetical protein
LLSGRGRLLLQVARHMALLCLKDESITLALRSRFRCVTIGAPLATLGRAWMAAMDALGVDVRRNFVSVLSAADALPVCALLPASERELLSTCLKETLALNQSKPFYATMPFNGIAALGTRSALFPKWARERLIPRLSIADLCNERLLGNFVVLDGQRLQGSLSRGHSQAAHAAQAAQTLGDAYLHKALSPDGTCTDEDALMNGNSLPEYVRLVGSCLLGRRKAAACLVELLGPGDSPRARSFSISHGSSLVLQVGRVAPHAMVYQTCARIVKRPVECDNILGFVILRAPP